MQFIWPFLVAIIFAVGVNSAEFYSEQYQITNFATVLKPGRSYTVNIRKNVDLVDLGYTPGFWGDLEWALWDWSDKNLKMDLSIRSEPWANLNNLTVCLFPEQQLRRQRFDPVYWFSCNPDSWTDRNWDYEFDFTPVVTSPSWARNVNPFSRYWCMTQTIESLNMCFPERPLGSVQIWNPSNQTVPIVGYVKTYL